MGSEMCIRDSTKALRQVVTAVSDGAVAVHYAEEYLTENR